MLKKEKNYNLFNINYNYNNRFNRYFRYSIFGLLPNKFIKIFL